MVIIPWISTICHKRSSIDSLRVGIDAGPGEEHPSDCGSCVERQGGGVAAGSELGAKGEPKKKWIMREKKKLEVEGDGDDFSKMFCGCV